MSNENVTNYFENQPSPQKQICRKLRALIFKTVPSVTEEMKWGVPTYAQGKFYMVGLQTHVNLGFSLKELTIEEQKLLQGSGKTMRHIEIHTINDIDEKKIIHLLKQVIQKR